MLKSPAPRCRRRTGCGQLAPADRAAPHRASDPRPERASPTRCSAKPVSIWTVEIDLSRVTHGGYRADRRVGYDRQRVQLQRALPRSLWRALRRAALWMAGRRHLPVLLTVGTVGGHEGTHPSASAAPRRPADAAGL